MKQIRIIVATVSLLLVTAGLFFHLSNKTVLGSSASIKLTSIDGRKISLEDLHGRPVLISFWASSCSTCLKEMPHLISLYQELNPFGLEIIGIAMPYDPPNLVLETVKSKQIPYPVALDIDGAANHAFGDIAGTPTSFLISPDGMIIEKIVGEMKIEKLREKIVRMLDSEIVSQNQKSG